jgi:hypothetical protein
MAEHKLQNPNFLPARRPNLLIPAFLLWGAVMVVIVGYFLIDVVSSQPGTRYYLLPWTFLTGIVIVAPSIYLFFKKKLDPFNPLVFAAWSYFFPAFFIGGLIVSGGFSNPYFLNFVQQEEYDLPLTLVYVMLGYGGLTIGFFLPFGKKIGELISRVTPTTVWQPEQIFIPGLILFGLGLAYTVLAFTSGILGFQRVTEVGAFDGVIYLLTFFSLEASVLLWLAIFRSSNLNINHYFVIGILLFTALTRSAFQGNRGSLLHLAVLIVFCFVISGKKILLKHKIWGGALVSAALFIGMIYGTTFRTIKTTEEQVSMDQYAGNVVETFEKISSQDFGTTAERGFLALTERFENVSQLAVVVSNYESLATYEADYGLENNILKDSIQFLIPRFLWHDKSVATDAYKYGDLYFNMGENAFTLTPMGDLLRNFGPIGVPLGMILIGIFLRLIYRSLIEDQEFSFWRATLYYMLLTTISYEGSFGLLIPYEIKIGIVAVFGLFLVKLMITKVKWNPARSARA